METSSRQQRLLRTIFFAALLLLAAVIALQVDLLVARQLHQGRLPGELRRLLALSESFAHGYGAACAMLLVWTLTPTMRFRLPRLVVCTFLPGLIVNVIKFSVGRYRPNSFGGEFPASVWNTFVGWFPAFLHSDLPGGGGYRIQSFPSGHSATAVGLALALSWAFPRGRWVFAGLAVLAVIQRLESGAHFLSDTLTSTALALLVSALVLGDVGLGRWFTRRERRFEPSEND